MNYFCNTNTRTSREYNVEKQMKNLALSEF